MAEAAVVEQPSTGNQQPESLGWRSAISPDLQQNEVLTSYKNVNDLAKVHIETVKKTKDLEAKVGSAIFKPGENATQEERNQYLTSLGRPEKPEGYEFVAEDKNASEWNTVWRNELHRIGIPKDMAKELSQFNHNLLTQMVEKHNAKIQAEIAETSTKLKAELGDKYDASVTLAARLWKEWGKTEVDFDKAFASETSATRVTMIRFLLNVAAKTGEDSSQRGSGQRGEAPKAGYDLSKFKLPPAKV
jgi:hypothetical protein